MVEQRTENTPTGHELVSNFLKSRRQGLSPQTIKFYSGYLTRAVHVIGLNVTGQHIARFLDSLQCSNGGKHAYYRALQAFYGWLFSRKSGYDLNSQHNPILIVDSPKVEKKILPSLTIEQLEYLIEQKKCVRDKAIISLFADSGLRLSELANIEPQNIDWDHRLIKVKCKGNKEGLAVFGERTKSLLRGWLSEYSPNGRLWDINSNGINIMLRRLMSRTGLPCNPHTFRRTFASILAKRGIDSWRSMAHINTFRRLSSQSLSDIKKSGCRELFLGIESGNDATLRHIRKPFSVDTAYKTICRILDAGIPVKCYFILGFPGETEAASRDTLNFASRLREYADTKGVQLRISPFRFRPYHGTALYDELIDKGRTIKQIQNRLDISDSGKFNPYDCVSENYADYDTNTLDHFINEMEKQNSPA